ncbi:GGDEF domain-containing protein [Viridibacterium curvum]|uniref:diguanylate cyclase n=1 Tax=Viridibacterium curvum TaxID=1101404 RepID=A0ABP9QXU3_9RHOO
MTTRLLKLIHWLNRIARPIAAVLGVGLLILIAVLDAVTGPTLALSILYLGPIALIAWRLERNAAISMAIFAGIVHALLNPHSIRSDSSTLIAIWNVMILCAIFAVFAVIIYELNRLLEKERDLARTDFLTGTRNRMAFLKEVDQEILRAVRHGQPISLVYVDLDNFKAINDRLGHREGDRLLLAVGQTLMQTIRGIDTVSRLGGDEFVILLPNADSDAAATVAPRIRQALLARMKQDLWPVTFSIGVLTCPIPPGSAEQLIHRADELMYRAKLQGKDRLVFSVQSA